MNLFHPRREDSANGYFQLPTICFMTNQNPLSPSRFQNIEFHFFIFRIEKYSSICHAIRNEKNKLHNLIMKIFFFYQNCQKKIVNHDSKRFINYLINPVLENPKRYWMDGKWIQFGIILLKYVW